MAVVMPAKGDEERVAKLLLKLAEHPGHVETTGDGPAGVSFIVSDELAEKFDKANQKGEPAVVELDAEEDESSEEETPKPKRGRPAGSKNKPKNAEDKE